MSCEEFQERITLSLYGELSDAEGAELAAHLLACADCRAVREALAGTVALLRREAAPRRRDWRGIAVAAAVLLMAGGTTMLSLLSMSEPHEKRGRPPAVAVAPDLLRRALELGTGAARAAAGPLGLRAEDRLCAFASDADPLLASRAVEWLADAGSSRSTPALRAALARPATRLAAFRALAARGALDLAADLVPALDDPLLRRDAAGALAARKSESALAVLLRPAFRGDETCRAACRVFPPALLLPALRSAAADPAGRATAIELLLTTDGDPFRQELLDLCRADEAVRTLALVRAARDEGDARASRFLLLALADGALGAPSRALLARVPVRRLRPALEAGLRDPELRPALVDFLAARAGECSSRDLLISVLADPIVRPTAARALFEQGDTRPAAILLRSGAPADLAAFDALPDEVRRRELARAMRLADQRRAAVAAVTSADAGLWRELVALLPVAELRVSVAAALVRSDAARAVPFLIPYVSPASEASPVREALVALAGVDLGEESYRWDRWWKTGAPGAKVR